MSRKANAIKLNPDDPPENVRASAIHGELEKHPLFKSALVASAGAPANKAIEAPETFPLEFAAIQQMGRWLYELFSLRDTRGISTEFHSVEKLVAHCVKQQVVDVGRERVKSKHSELQTKLGRSPSLKELNRAVGGGGADGRNKTLERAVKVCGLHLLREDDIGVVRKITDELSHAGRSNVDAQQLRSQLRGKRFEFFGPDSELFGFVAACGGRLPKIQIFTEIVHTIKARAERVTDFDVWAALPLQVRKDYDLTTRSAIRTFASEQNLPVFEDEECDRDNPDGRQGQR